MAIGKPKPEPEESGMGSDEEISAYGEYADDLFDALKSNNKVAFKTALAQAIKACHLED